MFVQPVGKALVLWTDHAMHNGEWDGDEALATMTYRSLGWLLPMRDDGIVRLAQSWDTRTDQYSEVLALDPRVVEGVMMLTGADDDEAPLRLTKTRPYLGSEKSGGQDQAEAQS